MQTSSELKLKPDRARLRQLGVNTAIVFIAFVGAQVAPAFVGSLADGLLHLAVVLTLFGLLLAAIEALLLGLFQQGRRLALGWLLAGCVGVWLAHGLGLAGSNALEALSLIAGLDLPAVITFLAYCLIAVTTLGLVQWLVWRRFGQASPTWIAANVLAAGLVGLGIWLLFLVGFAEL